DPQIAEEPQERGEAARLGGDRVLDAAERRERLRQVLDGLADAGEVDEPGHRGDEVLLRRGGDGAEFSFGAVHVSRTAVPGTAGPRLRPDQSIGSTYSGWVDLRRWHYFAVLA